MAAVRRALGAALSVAVACAKAPTQTYPGPPLPRSEVAVLRETPDAGVLAVDGANVWGGSWSLKPGFHEVLVRFRMFTTVPNVNWTIWSYCRVVLGAVAGEDYSALVRVRKELAPGISERVLIEIGIADADGVLRGKPRSCQPKRPRLEK